MRGRNAYGRVPNGAVAIVLSLVLLLIAFWWAFVQWSAGGMERFKAYLEEAATLEAAYIGSCLSGLWSQMEIEAVDPARREVFLRESLQAVVDEQNQNAGSGCRFKLLGDGAAQAQGFSSAVSETGEELHTYCVPVPGSVWAVVAFMPKSEAAVDSDYFRQVGLVLALQVFGIFVLLVLLNRLDSKRRQKELLAANERLRVSDERFRIAVAHTAYMVFEYDLTGGMIRILNESPGQTLFSGAREAHVEQWRKLIHPGDQPAIDALGGQLAEGRNELSLVLRVQTLPGKADYRWCRLTLTIIRDSGGRPVEAVGTLADINEQQTETLKLRNKAERDPLTGLLNREECERKVERLLSGSRGESGGAFLLIDMDDFKALNDSKGHLTGDTALRTLAAVIRKVFRESDIAGWLGGDEFMVWLRDVADSAVVERKLAELQQALRAQAHGDPALPDLLLSVGVVFSRPGDHFPDLYNMADIALYQAKREGRNRYVYYRRAEQADCS